MADDSASNTYEEIRKQQLLDNQKRFEDLGILKISKTLSDLTKSEKTNQPRQIKRKPATPEVVEPRRSSRERTTVQSYRDDVDIGLPSLRKRSKWNSSWATYLARPISEVKTASYEEKMNAINCAEKVQSNLQGENPSFIKSMVRSHVYSCFWLGLPSLFCEEHLPKKTINMVLENEDGDEYDAVFIGERVGLSGGWRAFALEHKLDDGDALVFELVEPTRFKVYIIRASDCSTSKKNHASEPNGKVGNKNTEKNHANEPNGKIGNKNTEKKSIKAPKPSTKAKEKIDDSSPPTHSRMVKVIADDSSRRSSARLRNRK